MNRIVICLFAVVAIAGCKEEDSALTCGDAMENFYSNNCVMTIDGDIISEADATSVCESNRALGEDYGCDAEAADVVACFDGVDNSASTTDEQVLGECNRCFGELDTLYACVNAAGVQ